jgi:hypothetical protein
MTGCAVQIREHLFFLWHSESLGSNTVKKHSRIRTAAIDQREFRVTS